MYDFFSNNQNQKSKIPEKNGNSDLGIFATELLKAILMIVALGVLFTLNEYKSKHSKLSKLSKRVTWIWVGGSLLVSALCAGVLHFFVLSISFKVPTFLCGAWLSGFAITLSILTMTRKNDDLKTLRIEDLEAKYSDFAPLKDLFDDPNNIPIGISLKDGAPITIPLSQISQHSLASGSTGEGKTTYLKTVASHFIRHGRPVIIIDPKGERGDVEEFRELCRRFGRPEAFKLFSLSAISESCFYSPTKIGDAQQLKSKIMNGLNLTHEYYGAVADEFLSAVLDAHKILTRTVTLEQIQRYIVNPSIFSLLEKDVRNLPSSAAVDAVLEKLLAARKMDIKELKGLSAQLTSLSALEIKDILNPSGTRPEIDLLETLQSGGVAYFQMNVNGYSSISKAIGKLIVQDLRLVSNMIQAGQAGRNYDLAFVSIDEMGSFVYLDFADVIKQVRSAGIGFHLSFQGIADLRQISHEFAEQILGNTAAKIIFRQDIKDDVETWSAMAGTKDTVIESFQTNNGPFGESEKTGMGNLHEGKTVLIDYDVIKRLTTGKAVFIDKKRHCNYLLSVWNGEVRASAKKAEPLLLASQKSRVGIRKVALSADENNSQG